MLEAAQRRTKREQSWIWMVFYFSDRFSPEHGPIFGKLFMQSLDVSLIEVSLFTNLSLLYFSPPFSTKIVPLPVRIIPFLIGSNCFRSLFSLSLFLFFFLSFHSIFTSPNSDASFHEFSIGRFTAVEWKFYSFVPWWFSLNPQTPLDNVWPKSPFEGESPAKYFRNNRIIGRVSGGADKRPDGKLFFLFPFLENTPFFSLIYVPFIVLI